MAQGPSWVRQAPLDTVQLRHWVIFAGFWCHNPLPLQTALHQPLNPTQPNCICRRLTCQWPVTLIFPWNDFGLRGQTIKKQQLKRISWVRIKVSVPLGCLPNFWDRRVIFFWLFTRNESNIHFVVHRGWKGLFCGKVCYANKQFL